MNPQKLNWFKQRLREELEMITTQLQKNQKFGMNEAMNPSIGELSAYDNHPADIGSELFEREKDIALSNVSHRHIQEVQAALNRIESGTYGKCEICQKSIDEERLEAIPWAKTCAEHQPKSHSQVQRPVEEKVIQPFRRSRDNAYDREDTWQDVERYGTSNPPDFFQEGKSYNELTIHDQESRGQVEEMDQISSKDLEVDLEGENHLNR